MGRVRNPKSSEGPPFWDWRFPNKKSLFFGVGPGCCSSLIMGYLGICVRSFVTSYHWKSPLNSLNHRSGNLNLSLFIASMCKQLKLFDMTDCFNQIPRLCDKMLVCNYVVRTNSGTIKNKNHDFEDFLLQVWRCLLSMLVFGGCIL